MWVLVELGTQGCAKDLGFCSANKQELLVISKLFIIVISHVALAKLCQVEGMKRNSVMGRRGGSNSPNMLTPTIFSSKLLVKLLNGLLLNEGIDFLAVLMNYSE